MLEPIKNSYTNQNQIKKYDSPSIQIILRGRKYCIAKIVYMHSKRRHWSQEKMQFDQKCSSKRHKKNNFYMFSLKQAIHINDKNY